MGVEVDLYFLLFFTAFRWGRESSFLLTGIPEAVVPVYLCDLFFFLFIYGSLGLRAVSVVSRFVVAGMEFRASHMCGL